MRSSLAFVEGAHRADDASASAPSARELTAVTPGAEVLGAGAVHSPN